MNFTDEKDYIMRMIKETIRVLFVVAFGEKYVSVELENKYEVSGKNLKDFLDMIDAGQINEAENLFGLHKQRSGNGGSTFLRTP